MNKKQLAGLGVAVIVIAAVGVYYFYFMEKGPQDYHTFLEKGMAASSIKGEDTESVMVVQGTKDAFNIQGPDNPPERMEDFYDTLESISETLDKTDNAVMSLNSEEGALIVIEGNSEVAEDIEDMIEDKGLVDLDETVEHEGTEIKTTEREKFSIAAFEEYVVIASDVEIIEDFIDDYPQTYEPPEEIDSKLPDNGRITLVATNLPGDLEEVGYSTKEGKSVTVIKPEDEEAVSERIKNFPKRITSNLMGIEMKRRKEGDYYISETTGEGAQGSGFGIMFLAQMANEMTGTGPVTPMGGSYLSS